MGYTTTTDRATGYVVTATDWNILEDNSTFLYGDLAWTTVTLFGTNWSAGTVTPRFILLGRQVYIQGLVNGGAGATLTSNMFTLPVGYRPSVNQFFAVGSGSSSGTFGLLAITTLGAVELNVGTAANSQISVYVNFAVV